MQLRKKIKLDKKSTCNLKIHELPEELVDEIIGYCKINDILKLSEVNKFWNNYIKTSQKWMKKITLTVTERNYREIINCTRQYQKVCINSKPPLRYEALGDALQHQFWSISDIEMPIINLTSITFPNLKRLHLKNSWEYCVDKSLDERDFYFTKPRRDTQKRIEADLIRTYSYLAQQLDYLHLSTDINSAEFNLAPKVLQNLQIWKISLVNQEPISVNDCIVVLNEDLRTFDRSRFNQSLRDNHIRQIHDITYDYVKINAALLCTTWKKSTPANPQ